MEAASLVLVRGALTRGDLHGAIALAEELARGPRTREALQAWFEIGAAYPAQQARCSGVMGDLHAQLGELDEARARYAYAGEAGAPPDRIAERQSWLAGLAQQQPTELYVAQGLRDPGWWHQQGVMVLAAQYVAFLPTEPRKHVAAIAAKAVVGFAGVLVLDLGRRISPAQLLPYLQGLPPASLEQMLPSAIQQLGGVRYARGEAEYFEQKLPLGVRLSFVTHDDRIVVSRGKAARVDPRFQRIVSSWPRSATR